MVGLQLLIQEMSSIFTAALAAAACISFLLATATAAIGTAASIIFFLFAAYRRQDGWPPANSRNVFLFTAALAAAACISATSACISFLLASSFRFHCHASSFFLSSSSFH